MWEASDIYALIKFKFDRANCIRLNSESLYPAKFFSDFIDMYVILYFFLPSYPSRTKSSIVNVFEETNPKDTDQMPGYQLYSLDQQSLGVKYMCNSCHLLLKDAVQTKCAHFYCNSCLGSLYL